MDVGDCWGNHRHIQWSWRQRWTSWKRRTHGWGSSKYDLCKMWTWVYFGSSLSSLLEVFVSCFLEFWCDAGVSSLRNFHMQCIWVSSLKNLLSISGGSLERRPWCLVEVFRMVCKPSMYAVAVNSTLLLFFWNFVNVLVVIFPLCSLQGMQVSLFGHWIQFQSINLVYVFWIIVWYLLIEQDDSAEWRKKQVCKTITFLFKDLSLSHFWISAVLLY